MIVLFSSYDGSPPAVMLKEQILLEDLGIEYALIDLTALQAGKIDEALRRVKSRANVVALYRAAFCVVRSM